MQFGFGGDAPARYTMGRVSPRAPCSVNNPRRTGRRSPGFKPVCAGSQAQKGQKATLILQDVQKVDGPFPHEILANPSHTPRCGLSRQYQSCRVLRGSVLLKSADRSILIFGNPHACGLLHLPRGGHRHSA
jgi:hypothetical protein